MTPSQTMTAAHLLGDIAQLLAAGDMPGLERLVFTHRDNAIAKEVLDDLSFTDLAVAARQAYQTYEVADEVGLRARLMSTGKQEYAASEPVQRTHEYVPLEVAAADVQRSSVYCHVGCGPLPETLLAVAAKARPRVAMGIDADAMALADGRDFAQHMAPRGKLRFMHRAGEAVNYGNFTHIHVAVLVRPELAVVRRVCQTASMRWPVTILLRSVDGLASLLYRPLAGETQEMLTRYGFAQVATVRGHALMNTVIYRR